MHTSRTAALLAATAMLAMAFATAPPMIAPDTAAAATTGTVAGADDPATYGADHIVDAGARDPDLPPGTTDGARFEYLAYYPEVLQIHRGDVVYFRLVQFHTVTFSDPDEPWRGIYRTDEVRGPLVYLDGALPSHPDCGRNAADEPCVVDDPTTYVNSGWNLDTDAFQGDLKVQFDLPVGAYTYYCTVHPGMQGTIAVVEDEEQVPTPAQTAQTRAEEAARDTAAGEAVIAAPPTVPGPELVGDHRRWTVQVGATTTDQRVAVLRYFPSVLSIEPGDEVEFFVPDAFAIPPGRREPAFEGHTVAIEPDGVGQNDPVNPFIRYLVSGCDPDDLNGGRPGYVHPASFIIGCPDPTHLPELAFQPQAFRRPDGVPWDSVPPGTYYDSGIMGPQGTPCRFACDPYDGSDMLTSRVRASFPVAGDVAYRCFLHGSMDGTIRVGN